MLVKELKQALIGLGNTYDNCQIEVWLPGSYIRLSPQLVPNANRGKVLIEGNLNPGSALGRD